MQEFKHVVTCPHGMHATVSGSLVRMAKECHSSISIQKNDRSSNATNIIGVMNLAIKCGETITVRVEGQDEEKEMLELKRFLEKEL